MARRSRVQKERRNRWWGLSVRLRHLPKSLWWLYPDVKCGGRWVCDQKRQLPIKLQVLRWSRYKSTTACQLTPSWTSFIKYWTGSKTKSYFSGLMQQLMSGRLAHGQCWIRTPSAISWANFPFCFICWIAEFLPIQYLFIRVLPPLVPVHYKYKVLLYTVAMVIKKLSTILRLVALILITGDNEKPQSQSRIQVEVLQLIQPALCIFSCWGQWFEVPWVIYKNILSY